MIKNYKVINELNIQYNIVSNILDMKINDNLIIKTSRGEEFVKIVDCKKVESEETNDIYIIRKADSNDYQKYLKNLKTDAEVLKFAKKEAERFNLTMTFLSADLSFDRKNLLINFLSDSRVDFRELAKVLAAKYKARVELRQIGARDKAKIVNGIGPCGRPLCCATFLTKLDSISMNMAKNQGLSLNPSKINGSCGRLMCCLTYENTNYNECKKQLPTIGKEVDTAYGKGIVIAQDVLNLVYTVKINNEIKEIKVLKNESREE